ncbi:MAG: tRNA lysidine(34) synthetase TilS, partial [Candidatus Binatia bacterium]
LLLEKKRARLAAMPPYSYLLTPGKEIAVREAGWRITMTPPLPWKGAPSQARLADPWQAVFDASALSGTLIVRNFRPGDRLRPLGMIGHKKVHDIFIDRKVPPERRRLLPLVLVGEEVAWVPGYVRGERAKVTALTRWVCRVAVNPLPEKQELC